MCYVCVCVCGQPSNHYTTKPWKLLAMAAPTARSPGVLSLEIGRLRSSKYWERASEPHFVDEPFANITWDGWLSPLTPLLPGSIIFQLLCGQPPHWKSAPSLSRARTPVCFSAICLQQLDWFRRVVCIDLYIYLYISGQNLVQ